MNASVGFGSDLHWQDTGMTASQYRHMRLHGSDLLGVAESTDGLTPAGRMGTTPHGEVEDEHLAVSGDSIAIKTKPNT